jgi:hypothetical protein
MSHTALRRVVIRLLYDPTLAEALSVDPRTALAGADVSDDELAWLLAVPSAAWRVDPARPERLLAALADEYPGSLALAPARAGAFVQSPHFHQTVQERGSLAVAFGDHMAADADPRLVAVARLERATAVVRRAPRRLSASPPGRLRLTPAGRVIRLARGAGDLLSALRAGIAPPRLGPGDEPLLVLRAGATLEVTIERLEEGLATLLEEAAGGTTRRGLEASIGRAGVAPSEAAAIVDDLVAGAVLI